MAIKIKPSHRGLLHKKLKVPMDKNISSQILSAKKHSTNSPTLKKEIIFAENAKKWNH